MRHVYFAKNITTGEIKIGYPSRRIKKLQYEVNSKLEMIYVFIGGGLKKERELHDKFEDIRSSGEWFLPDDKLLNFIEILKDNNLVCISGYNKTLDPDNRILFGFWTTTGVQEKIKEMAAADDRSVSSFMRMLIKREIKNYDRKG